MARVTVEDSLKVAKTRFGLVMLASQRARQLLKGSAPLLESKNREIVVALREIAEGKVFYAKPEYLKGSKEDFKPIPDSTEFIGDEEYLE
ncbi:MAG TPA: DNA-directed RNA polymerase subunit omega [Smithellaceae bacterium]|nr:DNA-directed RNA polymerase subunit omega [Smithellaceae bacterium]